MRMFKWQTDEHAVSLTRSARMFLLFCMGMKGNKAREILTELCEQKRMDMPNRQTL